MKDKKMYVVKFDNGLYWCGYNKVSDQIRKARIYNSTKYAREAGLDCISRRNYISPYNLMSEAVSFQIVEVELKEKETTEIY